ncbi:hypothetical protein ANT_09220 [Anaerolinea thermophila UNI-1]|uniref:Uncharacterized protein n=2 Tax=Anaerolinea thermophila TaxID=167964 RepID=E8N3E2_ANATU|nr:hypothetical protein ANT_09220 [Anaerolinea thermophila UNI-1]
MTTLASSRQQSDRHWWLWFLLFSLIFLLGVAVLALFVFSAEWVQASGLLPASLRSGLAADYSADLRAYSFRALQMGVIEEAIRDRERLGEPAGSSMLPTLAIFLQTPVPTITPTGFAGFNPTATAGTSPTPTLPFQEATPTGLITQTPTATLILSSTPTLVRSATPTQSPTSTLPASSPTRTPANTRPPFPITMTPSATRPTSTPPAPPTPTHTLPPPPPSPTPYQPPIETPPPPTPYP